MVRKIVDPSSKYKLSEIDLEHPKNAHDYQIILTGTNKKVLELGPASGYLSKILKDHGCHVTGIEIDPMLAKQAKEFVDKIIVGDIEELNLRKVLGTEKYDVILIGDFLEHLKNPNKLLQNLHDFLSDEGYVVCSIPNIAHGSIRIKLLNGEFRYRSTGLLDNTHLRFFTLDSILSMLQACGYSMVELKRVKEDIFGADGADLKPYTIPGELLESILRDPESTTFQYVFRAIPNLNNKTNLEWLEEFPKNITTEELKNRIDYNKAQIETLQNVNLGNQKTIHQHVDKINQLVKDVETLQNVNLGNQKTIQEKESQIGALQKSLENSQRMILDIHQSIVFRMLRKYDATIGKVIPLRPKKYLKSTKQELTLAEQSPQIKQALTNIPLKKKDILCFPIINWDYRYQRSQHIISKFAENGHRVFYFTVNLRTMEKPYEIKTLGNNIYQIELSSPRYFDIYKDKFDESLIQSLVKSIKTLQDDLKLDAFSLVMFPTWAPLVLKLKKLFNSKIIFDCLDDFHGFSNVHKERIKEEEILFKNSDLVMTTSSYLFKKASQVTSKTIFLPNAGEFTHFNKSDSYNILKDYKKPIIGYFGSIAEWFDKELIEFVATKRPDLSFIFIGHTYGSDIQKLRELKNVHFLGERPYSELPKYLHDFDVCLIPFKNIRLIDATHPVKIYEYMAAGKPVVASKMPELLSMKDLCYIAENKEDFLTKIDLALKENDGNLIKKRIEFAAKNTWQHRFERLISELNKIPSLDLEKHN